MSSPSLALRQRVLNFIQKERLIQPGDSVLPAVSGGPDSVAMLDVLHHLQPAFGFTIPAVLHFDHCLRGEESALDREFVRSLAERLGLPFHCESKNVEAFRMHHGGSVEMAARACRHAFFRESMNRFGARRLALGHTASDQAEEVLLRLLRGTGPSGMRGMLPSGGNGIIRPLLMVERRNILEYLNDRGLSWREDASNALPVCRRNVLRLDILPALEREFHPAVTATLSRHTELVREEESWWGEYLRDLWPTVCSGESGRETALSVPKLRTLHRAVLRRVLRFAVERLRGNLMRIAAVHIDALVHGIEGDFSGVAAHLPEGLRVERSGDDLIFYDKTVRAAPVQATSTMIHGPGTVELPSFGLILKVEISASLPSEDELKRGDGDVSFMDARKVHFPFEVRPWKPGDRFFPSGMSGSKKLQDFFTDLKIPRNRRHTIPILCDREKICRIIGFRTDDRVKVTATTREVVRVEALPNAFDPPARTTKSDITLRQNPRLDA